VDPVWIFATSFIVGLSGALVPGPMLTLTVSESMSRGFLAGPLIVLGHALLEVSLVAAFYLGLQGFFSSVPVQGSIGLLGGAALLWMGTGIFREVTRKHSPGHSRGHESISAWKNLVFRGVLVSLSNPYFILWWATVGFAYVLLSARYGLFGLLLFALGHLLSDLGWYSLVSFGVARGRNYLQGGAYRGILGGCGFFLVALAIYFMWEGWQSLRLLFS